MGAIGTAEVASRADRRGKKPRKRAKLPATGVKGAASGEEVGSIETADVANSADRVGRAPAMNRRGAGRCARNDRSRQNDRRVQRRGPKRGGGGALETAEAPNPADDQCQGGG